MMMMMMMIVDRICKVPCAIMSLPQFVIINFFTITIIS